MAYLACVYAESGASQGQGSLVDRKLTITVTHCRCHAEDILRIKDLGVLKRLSLAPIDMLVCRSHGFCLRDSAHGTQEIMGDISQYQPDREILHSWEEATGLPWDPFASCAVHTQREVVCPGCGVLVGAR